MNHDDSDLDSTSAARVHPGICGSILADQDTREGSRENSSGDIDLAEFIRPFALVVRAARTVQFDVG